MKKDELRELFNCLIGQWTLEREISSTDMGKGTLTGQCRFQLLGDDRLLLEEEGVLTLNGVESEVSRSYVYALRGNQLVILYNDPHRKGDVLHELSFSEEDGVLRSRHCHLCGEDRYSLDFVVSDAGRRIQMDYEVKGPKKDYRMCSVMVPKV